ncbi:hypothetical protein WG904_15995 [Pedobacter sp. Du54]|uniref:hypothetical protein n=1 Tax=Pedobacter anseongensis TaxID=3133439 RepID=UPI0030AE69D2
MKTILFSLSIFFIFLSANAQERPIKLEPKRNQNQSVDFNFQKTDPGTYTVVLNFSNLSNTSNPGTFFKAADYSGRLFSLTPTVKEQGIGYSYSFSYIRGKLKPKYDVDFIYLLPYKDAAKVQVSESNFLGATYFGDTTPDDWKSYRFYTNEQDTVTAIRKGIVVEIKDLYETIDENAVAYTSKTNELIIEHEDGTLATYRGFKKGTFTVKVGQTVFPGTLLGVNSRYDKNGKYNVSIMITYLKSADFENRSTSLSKSKSFYGFITPHFMTEDSLNEVLVSQKTYIVASTPQIIQKEMTKKELKLLSNPKK